MQYQQFVRELAMFQFQVSRGVTAAAVNMQEEQDYVQLQSRLEASIETVCAPSSASFCAGDGVGNNTCHRGVPAAPHSLCPSETRADERQHRKPEEGARSGEERATEQRGI